MRNRAKPANGRATKARCERFRKPTLAVVGPGRAKKIDDNRTGRQLRDRVEQHVRSLCGKEPTGKSHAQRTRRAPLPSLKRRERNPLVAARKTIGRDPKLDERLGNRGGRCEEQIDVPHR